MQFLLHKHASCSLNVIKLQAFVLKELIHMHMYYATDLNILIVHPTVPDVN